MKSIFLILSITLVLCQCSEIQLTTLDAKIQFLEQRVNEVEADIIENDWIVVLDRSVPGEIYREMVLDSHKLKKEESISFDSMRESQEIKRFLFIDNASREEIEGFMEKYQDYIKMVEPNAVLIRTGDVKIHEDEDDEDEDKRKCSQLNPDWGLDRIDQISGPLDGAYRYPEHKKEITVYVLDTGIDFEHEDFNGRASSYSSILGKDPKDVDGHGTHVAGTIGSTTHGVSKRVKLVGIKVIHCQTGSTDNILRGLEDIERKLDNDNGYGKSVINMSLGYGGDAPSVEAFINDLGKKVPFIVAAGNSGINVCNQNLYNLKEVIPVAATAMVGGEDVLASFSNRGKCIGIYAPGDSILSTDSKDRQLSCNNNNLLSGPNSYRKLSGTSMAAPMVAGWASLILQEKPGLSSSEMKKEMQNRAIRHKQLDPFHNNAKFIYNSGIRSNVGIAGSMILLIMVMFM